MFRPAARVYTLPQPVLYCVCSQFLCPCCCEAFRVGNVTMTRCCFAPKHAQQPPHCCLTATLNTPALTVYILQINTHYCPVILLLTAAPTLCRSPISSRATCVTATPRASAIISLFGRVSRVNRVSCLMPFQFISAYLHIYKIYSSCIPRYCCIYSS